MLPDDITHDARFALRQIRHRPGFSLIVILTLGVCIGVNTATFSLVHAARSKDARSTMATRVTGPGS
jgi:hypothetical protein